MFFNAFLFAYAAPAMLFAMLGVLLVRARASQEGSLQRLGRVLLLLSALWVLLGALSTVQAWRSQPATRPANEVPPNGRLVMRGNGFEIYATGDASLPPVRVERSDAGR